MRKLGIESGLTAQLWKLGLSWEEAVESGACWADWKELIEKYGQPSCLVADWNGHSEVSEAKAVAHTASHYNY